VKFAWLCSHESYQPEALLRHAVLAERAGFDMVTGADHFHPWVDDQSASSFVWTWFGAVAQATSRVELATSVTAPLYRYHPALIAQAAATVDRLSGGRFRLGVGTGERLNEQPFGERWPRSGERRERLAEAIDVIRALWRGDPVNHDGAHWRVENLTLYDRPAVPPRILVAAAGNRSARLAGESADGMIGVNPDARLIAVYRGSGGTGPCVGQVHVSLAATMEEALDNAWTWWPNGAVAPAALGELAQPEHFAAVAASARRESIRDTVVCATDAGPIVAAIDRFIGAGFDTVMLHQIGPDQRRLADLGAGELLGHYRVPE
jgi:coenzyme F420-dependent glucose-6-phosphate dehydrogenase